MSKMKHLLRKLHIGGNCTDNNNNRLPSADTSSRPPTTSSYSPQPISPVIDSNVAVSSSSVENVNDHSNASTVDSNFFEEEFQMQLALAISVSSGSVTAGEPDAETAQIKAAKQRSLGCSPDESVFEYLSLRYWSNHVINYDEKVMDGFYDVHGIASNSITQGKMPLLVDLQAITVSDNVDYEVILVNRMVDKDLRYLEERVSTISLECQAAGTTQIMSILIQKIANIVVGQMGGPVTDADEMLRKWTFRSYELRNLMNTIILPIGCLDVGLSRHRALLFKVLADKINLPCSLVKGSYYTGTDDGAVNLIKIDNGSEYIIDLMGAPGTLIPVEVQSCNLPTFGTSGSEVSSFIGSQSERQFRQLTKRNQTERFEYDFGKLLPSLNRPLEGPSGAFEITSPAQELQINDVSNCVINAAKNPDFAQKLHAVLLNSDVTSSDNLINVNNQEEGEPVHLLDADMLIMSNNEELRVNRLQAEHQLVPERNYFGYNLPFESTSFSEDDVLATNLVVKPLESQEREDFHKDDEKTKRLNMINLTAGEWEILWEDLQIGERIGIGSYGEVYRSEWNGTEVAVKKFMNQDISGDALTQFKGEIEIMLRLRHPNVVLFMGAVTRPPNLSILTEFLPRGSLYKLLHRTNVQLDEKRRMRMALDVAKGMNYLHTSNPVIVHRDLKTPNLLVDKNWVVKVCDFGMSRMKHHTFLSSKSTAGTPEWMAPEVLRNEPATEKCDVYSFGVILWELATLRVPWTELNSMQVVGAVGFQYRHLDIPETIDPVVARIITDCWHPEPQCRPSFKEIIARLRSLGRLSVERIETRINQ
ncbi:putative protein kinase TKL-CTR1-DRK-2 family [Helianthus anomalus]